MSQICPQMESLLSLISPVSSSEAGSTPCAPFCCAQDSFPSQGKAVLGEHAGPCLVPTLPLAYCYLSPIATAARPHAAKVSAEDRGPAQSPRCFREAPEDGLGTSPDRKPSQGGPAQLKCPTNWHGGQQRCAPCHMQAHFPRENPCTEQAGPRLCPLPTALCPPQVPQPHHTQRLAAGCQLSSGMCSQFCAGFAPAAASGDSERRGTKLQTPGSSWR